MNRVRHHVWWALPSFAVAAGLGLTVGYPIAWLAYAGFNVVGVWLYCDRHGPERHRTQSSLKMLAIVMLPVGVVGVLGSGGSGLTPRHQALFNSGAATRREASYAASDRD